MRASRIGPWLGHACTRACCVEVYMCVYVCAYLYIMIKYVCLRMLCIFLSFFFYKFAV